MKKNKMMRAASGLLVATLLTTSIISGTFAKYTTQDSASDTARVAKWGVTASASGSLFGSDYYAKSESNTSNKIAATYTGSVDLTGTSSGSSATTSAEKIVAPGTQSDKGMTLSVSGTPEVKTKISIGVDNIPENDYSDIYLANGTYGVMVDVTATTTVDNVVGLYTESNGVYEKVNDQPDSLPTEAKYYKLTDQVVVNEDITDATSITGSVDRFTDKGYYPIVWTLTNGTTTTYYGNVADLKTGITATSNTGAASLNASYDSNIALGTTAGYVTVKWDWNIGPDNSDNGTHNYATHPVNGADAILGNLMAYEADTSNYQVVKIDNTTITGIVLGEKGPEGKKIKIATVGDSRSEIAQLTVGFNANITVEQVD